MSACAACCSEPWTDASPQQQTLELHSGPMRMRPAPRLSLKDVVGDWEEFGHPDGRDLLYAVLDIPAWDCLAKEEREPTGVPALAWCCDPDFLSGYSEPAGTPWSQQLDRLTHDNRTFKANGFIMRRGEFQGDCSGGMNIFTTL